MFHVKQTEMVEIDQCPICSSKKLEKYMDSKDFFFTKEKFSLSKCASCGFVFTNPKPESMELGKYYETEDYLSHNSSGMGPIGFVYKTAREININGKYKLVSRHSSPGRIVDIGCGTGELLSFFSKKGWQALGIEPNDSAREFAKKEYGIEVLDEDNLARMKTASADVVSMWHVLEHVYDLGGRMNTLARLLTDDGIAVIALPMVDSPDSVKFGMHWAGLDLPRHLYHFTASSFEKLAVNHGFKIVERRPMKMDALYVSWLSHRAKGNKLAFVRGILDGLLSNLKAQKDSNYSSMIFVLRKDI